MTIDNAIGERRLWAAVLELAVKDALAPEPRMRAKQYGVEANWRASREYVKSLSFDRVCSLAGVEPEYAREKVLRKMEAI